MFKSKVYNNTMLGVKCVKQSHQCDAKVIEENRTIRCPSCGLHIDRDVNASRNILSRGLQKYPRDARFEPDAPQVEAMNQSKDGKQIVVSLIVGKR